MSQNDLAWPLQSESDPSEKKLFEHQKQKFRKLNEQLIDEKEKYSAAQREYYQLIQKSDKGQRPRVQAVFEKQKDNHNRRISHLSKKVESYRSKLNDLIRTHSNQASSSPGRHTIAAIQASCHENQFLRGDTVILENKKLVSNRSSKSNLEDEVFQVGGGQSDEESQKSSKRASIVDESTSHPERNTDHNLDSLIEETIHEYLTSRKIESNLLNLQHRIDIDILNDMEKMRTDCFQHYNYNNENEERLLERIKALEQELMDSNDNHVFEVTNLKSIIVELQEKLEYDCRRLNREFSEKLDNVYECIEKLEIGREKKLNKEIKREHESAEALKDFICSIVLGIFAIIFFILNIIQGALSPFIRSYSRTIASLAVLILSLILWNSSILVNQV